MTIQQRLLGSSAPLSATLDTSAVFGVAPAGPITTTVCTCTATGGTGVYTYSWSRVSGSGSANPDAPSSATTSFTDNLLGSSSAVFECTVGDGVTTVAATPQVSAEFER